MSQLGFPPITFRNINSIPGHIKFKQFALAADQWRLCLYGLDHDGQIWVWSGGASDTPIIWNRLLQIAQGTEGVGDNVWKWMFDDPGAGQ